MKKNYFIMILFMAGQIFSQVGKTDEFLLNYDCSLLNIDSAKATFGLINDNNLNVRNKPGLSGQVITKLFKGVVVSIHDELGTSEIVNGIWDYWYRITPFDKEAQWVNALYVDKHPWDIDVLSNNKIRFYEVPNSEKLFRQRVFKGLHQGMKIVNRTNKKISLVKGGSSNYFYQITSVQGKSLYDDKWVHGSEVRPLIGSSVRAKKMAQNPLKNDIPKTLKELFSNYGNPIKIKTIEEKQSRHQKNERIVLKQYFFEGISFKIMESESKIIIIEIEIFDKSIQLKYGLRIGLVKKILSEFLGKPYKIINDSLTYYSTDYGISEKMLVFKFKERAVTNIKWALASEF